MSTQERLRPAWVFERYFGPAIFMPWAHVLLEYAMQGRGRASECWTWPAPPAL